MKKVLALLLVGTLALSMTACGKTEDIVSTEPTTVEAESEPESVEPETVSEPETVAEEPETEEEVEFTIGEVNNNVYENTFLGIRFTPIDGMNFASDEELASLASTTKEILKDNESVKKSFENGSMIIGCYASSDNNASPIYTFNITMQNCDYIEGIHDVSMKSAAEIAEFEKKVIESAISSVVPTLENNGYTDIVTSIETAEFLGGEHPCMFLTANIPGYGKLLEREVVVIDKNHIASYTSSSIGSDTDITMDILNNVEALR